MDNYLLNVNKININHLHLRSLEKMFTLIANKSNQMSSSLKHKFG
jgi:hypothetical protein